MFWGSHLTALTLLPGTLCHESKQVQGLWIPDSIPWATTWRQDNCVCWQSICTNCLCNETPQANDLWCHKVTLHLCRCYLLSSSLRLFIFESHSAMRRGQEFSTNSRTVQKSIQFSFQRCAYRIYNIKYVFQINLLSSMLVTICCFLLGWW